MNNQEVNTIPDFKPKTEYPLGGFFKIGNEVFKVVLAGRANGNLCCMCDFSYGTENCRDSACASTIRTDKSEVCFILYDELEDNP